VPDRCLLPPCKRWWPVWASIQVGLVVLLVVEVSLERGRVSSVLLLHLRSDFTLNIDVHCIPMTHIGLNWVVSHLSELQLIFIVSSLSIQEFDSLSIDKFITTGLFCQMILSIIHLIQICLSCISDLLIKDLFFSLDSIHSSTLSFMAMMVPSAISAISISKPLVVSGGSSVGAASASDECSLCCSSCLISSP